MAAEDSAATTDQRRRLQRSAERPRGVRERCRSKELICRTAARPRPLRLGETALFLDLDGTLAPIAARPQDVHPDPRRTSLLERLAHRLDGRLAVVSGRTLADVDRILEGCVANVAAVHGLVRGATRTGVLYETPPHPELPRAVAGLKAFAAARPRPDGRGWPAFPWRCTSARSPAGGRGRPRQGPASSRPRPASSLQGRRHGRRTAHAPGARKGDSVRAFLGEPAFAGARPVFMGDDVTDEDGFAAAQALGGYGRGGRRRAQDHRRPVPLDRRGRGAGLAGRCVMRAASPRLRSPDRQSFEAPERSEAG